MGVSKQQKCFGPFCKGFAAHYPFRTPSAFSPFSKVCLVPFFKGSVPILPSAVSQRCILLCPFFKGSLPIVPSTLFSKVCLVPFFKGSVAKKGDQKAGPQGYFLHSSTLIFLASSLVMPSFSKAALIMSIIFTYWMLIFSFGPTSLGLWIHSFLGFSWHVVWKGERLRLRQVVARDVHSP